MNHVTLEQLDRERTGIIRSIPVSVKRQNIP